MKKNVNVFCYSVLVISLLCTIFLGCYQFGEISYLTEELTCQTNINKIQSIDESYTKYRTIDAYTDDGNWYMGLISDSDSKLIDMKHDKVFVYDITELYTDSITEVSIGDIKQEEKRNEL